MKTFARFIRDAATHFLGIFQEFGPLPDLFQVIFISQYFIISVSLNSDIMKVLKSIYILANKLQEHSSLNFKYDCIQSDSFIILLRVKAQYEISLSKVASLFQ